MGQTVNLLVYTFGGSNPSSPTKARSLVSGFSFERIVPLKRKIAEVAQSVEHQPSKLRVAGSSPVHTASGSVRISVSTQDFHSCKGGSIPPRTTKMRK